jgi:SAM-dependent methyltransferase
MMGVDRSANMIAIAEKRKAQLSLKTRELLRFKVDDIRSVSLGHRYDAVVSLFHVMSYLTEDADLSAAVQTARRHVKDRGAFIFDFWYGPAVIRNPPQPLIKTIRTGESTIRRTTVPELDQQRCLVCVNYVVEINNVVSGKKVHEREQHFVRYFFPDEIEGLLAASGFSLIRLGEWLTESSPSDSTFGVYALAQAI